MGAFAVEYLGPCASTQYRDYKVPKSLLLDKIQNRIFKIEKKRTCSRTCKDNDDSTESIEKDDIELASEKRDMSRNVTDEDL